MIVSGAVRRRETGKGESFQLFSFCCETENGSQEATGLRLPLQRSAATQQPESLLTASPSPHLTSASRTLESQKGRERELSAFPALQAPSTQTASRVAPLWCLTACAALICRCRDCGHSIDWQPCSPPLLVPSLAAHHRQHLSILLVDRSHRLRHLLSLSSLCCLSCLPRRGVVSPPSPFFPSRLLSCLWCRCCCCCVCCPPRFSSARWAAGCAASPRARRPGRGSTSTGARRAAACSMTATATCTRETCSRTSGTAAAASDTQTDRCTTATGDTDCSTDTECGRAQRPQRRPQRQRQSQRRTPEEGRRRTRRLSTSISRSRQQAAARVTLRSLLSSRLSASAAVRC